MDKRVIFQGVAFLNLKKHALCFQFYSVSALSTLSFSQGNSKIFHLILTMNSVSGVVDIFVSGTEMKTSIFSAAYKQFFSHIPREKLDQLFLKRQTIENQVSNITKQLRKFFQKTLKFR